MTTQTARKTSAKRRTASKQERQLQLIKATIRSIAKRGLSDTTMATVAGEAQLSQGIINLHFQSKERLLDATLRHLSDEYRQTWQAKLAKAGSSNAEKLAALVDVDFSRPVCERNKLAVWFAFWGESKSRPTYRKLCADCDHEYRAKVADVCVDLIREGQYQDRDAEAVASGLSAMCGGLWLNLLMSTGPIDRAKARAVCTAYLASVFPGHFSLTQAAA